jgi:hypothetical protein
MPQLNMVQCFVIKKSTPAQAKKQAGGESFSEISSGLLAVRPSV